MCSAEISELQISTYLWTCKVYACFYAFPPKKPLLVCTNGAAGCSRCLQPGEALAAVCKGVTFTHIQRATRKYSYVISASAFGL